MRDAYSAEFMRYEEQAHRERATLISALSSAALPARGRSVLLPSITIPHADFQLATEKLGGAAKGYSPLEPPSVPIMAVAQRKLTNFKRWARAQSAAGCALWCNSAKQAPLELLSAPCSDSMRDAAMPRCPSAGRAAAAGSGGGSVAEAKEGTLGCTHTLSVGEYMLCRAVVSRSSHGRVAVAIHRQMTSRRSCSNTCHESGASGSCRSCSK